MGAQVRGRRWRVVVLGLAAVYFVVPLLSSLEFSLRKPGGGYGVANYLAIATDPVLLEALTVSMEIAVITAVLVLSVSAQSVAREREFGTFDELMILPLRPYEILLGKVAPAFLVGLVNCALYAALIPLLYGVPLLGSVPLLLLAVVIYTMALVGLGLMISTIAGNQQQAFLGMFFVTVPLILLSGYASPVDNMPAWLQPVVAANPTRHMIVICEGIFLKDLPADLVLKHLWPMLVAAAATFTIALALFRARHE